MNKGQRDQLLKPLNPSRVAQRKGGGGRQLSYLEAWETRAHLIRVFGFGGYSSEVLTSELMFEEKMEKNWAVGYKVELRLHIKDLDATYKRAAINLGTQFGLSLYSDGSLKDVVGKTLDVDTLPEESA